MMGLKQTFWYPYRRFDAVLENFALEIQLRKRMIIGCRTRRLQGADRIRKQKVGEAKSQILFLEQAVDYLQLP